MQIIPITFDANEPEVCADDRRVTVLRDRENRVVVDQDVAGVRAPEDGSGQVRAAKVGLGEVDVVEDHGPVHSRGLNTAEVRAAEGDPLLGAM